MHNKRIAGSSPPIEYRFTNHGSMQDICDGTATATEAGLISVSLNPSYRGLFWKAPVVTFMIDHMAISRVDGKHAFDRCYAFFKDQYQQFMDDSGQEKRHCSIWQETIHGGNGMATAIHMRCNNPWGLIGKLAQAKLPGSENNLIPEQDYFPLFRTYWKWGEAKSVNHIGR